MKYKEVELPVSNKVPRWLVLQGEIDLRLFLLEKMLKDEKRKPPFVRMIDEAVGFTGELSIEAQELIAETRWLKREFYRETKLAQADGLKGKEE